MANRRKRPSRLERKSRRAAAEPDKPASPAAAKGAAAKEVPSQGVPHEVVAVLLGCLGLLTLLALLSFHPADASLNASGVALVHNWIGPFGAYWADLLLQAVGVSAYALGVGCLLAAWRALVGKHVWPGLREAGGLLLTVASVGALAHVLFAGVPRAYPAGGVVGAIVGELLREQLAKVGAIIVAGALVLASLALAADGVLAGLGLRGLVAVREVSSRVLAALHLWQERRRRLRERRLELLAADTKDAEDSGWSLGAVANKEDAQNRHQERLDEAAKRAVALADAQAEREAVARRARIRRLGKEPQASFDDHIDLPAEEGFELGELPKLDDTEPPQEDVVELEADAVDIDVPVRAAAPLALAPPPPPEQQSEEPQAPADASANAADKPKRRRNPRAGEPQIVDVRPEVDIVALAEADGAVESEENRPRHYQLPPVSLLDFEAGVRAPLEPQVLRDNALRLTKTLKDYGIEGAVREIRPGPVVTMYEYVPAPGTKVSKISGLADDLAMSMEALRVRIVAPIPGKGAVGIEIPNDVRETVYLKEIVASEPFKKQKSVLAMALGKDIEGNPYAADLARMPHLLVAGATGAGKSVSINTMIMSILFRATPDDVRMLMVDPKMLELSVYDGIPHLLLPVVTDPKKAALALRWAVEEMERRYALLSETGVRGIDSYNKKVRAAAERGEKIVLQPKKDGDEAKVLEPLPYLVVIVDELADLMMVASRDVEASIMRLAQMARAAGIHLILATQRPSVDVITGVIKANFPTRIAFQVASKHDSRTIIDANGAEHLLGRGDMLHLSPGVGGIRRVHGAFVCDEEIQRTVGFWKEQGSPQYDESILAPRPDADAGDSDGADEPADEMYDQAVAIVAETRQASISMIQRRLRIGYNRAARMVERMEVEGIVGPADGAKPREVLVSSPAA